MWRFSLALVMLLLIGAIGPQSVAPLPVSASELRSVGRSPAQDWPDETNRELILVPGIVFDCSASPIMHLGAECESRGHGYNARARAIETFDTILRQLKLPQGRVHAFTYGDITASLTDSELSYQGFETRKSLHESAMSLGAQIRGIPVSCGPGA